LGEESVFMDVDTIPPGVDFGQHIRDAVQGCDVVLAIMGDQWLDIAYADGPRRGQRRLDDPGDFVRLELEAALRRGIPVIPVLANRALVPRPEDLPESLRALASRQAVELRAGRDLNVDIRRLLRAILAMEGAESEGAFAPANPGGGSVSHTDGSGTTSGTFVGAHAAQERFDNALRMRLCWCPPGQFTMGDEKTAVSATLSRGFWLGKYPVTQAEWQAITNTTIREQRDKSDPNFALSGEGPRFPMYYVDHHEATKFCGKLTDQEWRAGRLPREWEYRLPTEAQWEYACRAGTKTQFFFGDDEADLVMYGWCKTNSGGTTRHVGEKRANAWGLHDMHGNVWEWCRDWYQEMLPGGLDPEAAKGGAAFRALRGGCWYSRGGDCRSATRDGNAPGERYYDLGFRLAAVQVSQSPLGLGPS
jgi:formylglycine-generating enzyme required for sulfatase activity